jgi:hypothetical protein
MKAVVAVLVLVCCAATPGVAQTPPLDAKNVLSWPRAPIDKFGCMLERDFETKDAKFNCALRNYVHVSNVCDPASPYYEGPEFPAGKAAKIMEQFEEIRVAHEHGEVQAVTVVLKQRLTQTAIRTLLGLPISPRAVLPANIASVDIQGCQPDLQPRGDRGFRTYGRGRCRLRRGRRAPRTDPAGQRSASARERVSAHSAIQRSIRPSPERPFMSARQPAFFKRRSSSASLKSLK